MRGGARGKHVHVHASVAVAVKGVGVVGRDASRPVVSGVGVIGVGVARRTVLMGKGTTHSVTTALGTSGHPRATTALSRRRRRRRIGGGGATTTTTTTTTQMRAITDSSNSAEGVPTPTTLSKLNGASGGGGNGGGDDEEEEGEEMIFGLPGERVFKPLAILLSSQFILFIGVGALLPALPLYAQSIGLDGTANGVVLSAPALAMLLLNLPAGRLVDSWGRKQMMMSGMFVIALSDLATSQCRTVLALIPARLCLGAGRSAAEGGDRAYLADLSDRFPAARGTISGTQQAVQALGLVIGPLIGGYAAELYGPTSVFYLISSAAMMCTLGYGLLPNINVAAEREEERIRLSMDMSQEEEEEFELELQAIKAASDWRVLFRSNRQRVITAAAGANALGFVAKLTCIPWFATSSLGATPQQVGELFSLTALLGMASAPVGGVIADKIGLKAVIVASLVACAVGLGLAQEASDVSQLQLCIGLWGIGTAAAGPAVNALAQESAPKGGEGEALGLPKTAGDLVFLAGPVILGAIDDQLGSSGASLWLVSATAGLSAAATLVYLRPLGEEDGDQAAMKSP